MKSDVTDQSARSPCFYRISKATRRSFRFVARDCSRLRLLGKCNEYNVLFAFEICPLFYSTFGEIFFRH